MNVLTTDFYFQKTFLEEIQERTIAKVNYKIPEERVVDTIQKNIDKIKSDIGMCADDGLAFVRYEYDIRETAYYYKFFDKVLEYFRLDGFKVETILGDKTEIASGHTVYESQKVTTTISWE